MRLIALYSSNEKYGIGHEKRTANLLNQLGIKNSKLEFETYEVNELNICEVLNNFLLLPESRLILDVDPRVVTYSKQSLVKKFAEIDNSLFIYFESGNTEADGLISDIFKPKIKIYPYGLKSYSSNKNYYSGFTYSLFSKELIETRKLRKLRDVTENIILISCGGSDPSSCTLKFLDLCSLLPENTFMINVIIGKHFSKKLRQQIASQTLRIKQTIALIESPPDLGLFILNSKIGFTTGGLSRNEFLFCGLPTIVMDINRQQAYYSKMLEENGFLRSVGLASEYNNVASDTKFFIQNLLDNSTVLQNYSKKSFELFATTRIDILLNDIIELCN